MEILLIEVFMLKREGTLLIVFSLLSMHLQVSHPHRKDWIQPHLLRHSSSGITRPHARAMAMAKKFAKSESTKSTISKIFKSAYGRPATQAEIELSQSFLDQWLNNQEPNKEPQVNRNQSR